MISVIIETGNDEARLAHALAALVPAATEGAVRDVVVVDHASQDGTRIVADAAGCALVEVRKGEAAYLRRAVETARSDWLLFLSPSVSLNDGWQSGAFAFIDRTMVSGTAQAQAAILRRGRFRSGWLAHIVAFFMRGDGVLISKNAWLARETASRVFSSASSVSGARRGAA